jgi:hypothetical protein
MSDKTQTAEEAAEWYARTNHVRSESYDTENDLEAAFLAGIAWEKKRAAGLVKALGVAEEFMDEASILPSEIMALEKVRSALATYRGETP